MTSAVSASVAWLDAHNGRGPDELSVRLGKVAEELGEAWAAWIGVTGQNPRKGRTHTRDELADELADVVLAALTAARSLGGNVECTYPAACVAEVPEISAALLTLTAAVGSAASAWLDGDRTHAVDRLATVVASALDAVRRLGLDPALVLARKADAVRARIAVSPP